MIRQQGCEETISSCKPWMFSYVAFGRSDSMRIIRCVGVRKLVGCGPGQNDEWHFELGSYSRRWGGHRYAPERLLRALLLQCVLFGAQ